MSSNYSFSRDIKEVKAMTEGLENYVRGKQLYGYVSGGIFARMPSLTAGAMLLRLRRLNELRAQLKDFQMKNLDFAIDLYQGVREDWTHHYQEKLLQEAFSRLEAMQGFFFECADSITRCAGAYRPELSRRSIVQEILHELSNMEVRDKELNQKVRDTDTTFAKFMRPAGFQWSEVLIPAYPEDEFWWLYQRPPDL